MRRPGPTRRVPRARRLRSPIRADEILSAAVFAQIEIKQVLERLYGLEVANVNTLNREGKLKRSHYPLGRAKTLYRRADVKLAYVTLKELVKFPAPPLKEEPAAGKR